MDISKIDMVIDEILIEFKEEKEDFKLSAFNIEKTLIDDINRKYGNNYFEDAYNILNKEGYIENKREDIFVYLTPEGKKAREEAIWREVTLQ